MIMFARYLQKAMLCARRTFSVRERELSRLESLPRYIPGCSTKLFRTPFKYVDSCTLAAGYREIFSKEVYKFTSTNNSPRIIDCGSNVGLSVLYFKTIFPSCHICAFEPDTDIFNVLYENIRASNLTDVVVNQSAIWTTNGKSGFQLEGGFSGRIPKPGDNSRIVFVPTTRLKDLLTRKVDFLKIDIEGAEYDVLKDIRAELSMVDKIFIEYHSHSQEPQTLHELLEIISTAGFRYHIQGAYCHDRPYIDRELMLGMDLQLNIFGYRLDE